MQEIIENIEKDIEFHKHFPDEEWALILDGNEAKKIFYHLKSTTWQPIETAPRNEHKVLLSIKGYDHPVVGWHDHDKRWRSYEFIRSFHESKIMGWMPLPESPVRFYLKEFDNV